MNNKKPLVIMKFGGSCLENSKTLRQTLNIVEKYLKNSKVIIVTSAIKGVTDKLIDFYKKSCEQASECDFIIEGIYNIHKKIVDEVIDENKSEYKDTLDFLEQNFEELTLLGRILKLLKPSNDIQDIIMSYGEKLSTFIFSQYVNSKELNIKSQFISSDEIIITDNNFGNALPLLEECENLIKEKIVPMLESNKIDLICITGFYGTTKDKKITTLGRGGSDLSAAILAYCLEPHFSCKVIFWKDVKGFLNADPKISKKTELLKRISYIEAKELAFFGSKVLHPVCLDVNEKRNILSEIRDFNDPDAKDYTKIVKEVEKSEEIIKAITSIERLTMITIESGTMISLPGTISKLFSLLGDNNINIKFISQSSSENNVTFGIDLEDSMKASFLLRNSELFGKQWFNIKIDNDISLIAVIGAGMLRTPGVAGKIFTTLGNNSINVKAISQGSSELNITFIIERKDCKNAVNVLYDVFINSA